ncbi:MAG: TIGR03643 family protein [Phormidesmis sp.]
MNSGSNDPKVNNIKGNSAENINLESNSPDGNSPSGNNLEGNRAADINLEERWAKPDRPDVDDLSMATVDRVLEMAWEDRTTFEVIEQQFGLKEKDVIAIMRRHMKPSSFRMWRKRVSGRKTKHAQKRAFEVGRFKSSNQKNY